MKLLTLALLAILFVSCTKETPLPKQIKGNFHSQSVVSEAHVLFEDSNYFGNWRWGMDFTRKDTTKGYVFFVDPVDDATGAVNFKCTFDGATLIDAQYGKDSSLISGTYSGHGTWFIEKSEGTFSMFTGGSGVLSYQQIVHSDQEPEFVIDIVGWGK